MNTIKFKNKDIEPVYTFLVNTKLQGRMSRARTTLCKELERKFEEITKAKLEIQKEYGKLDQEKNLITGKDGKIEFETEEKEEGCVHGVDELFEEIATIECTEILDKLQVLHSALDVLDESLEGQDAVMYDLVCTQLENIKA